MKFNKITYLKNQYIIWGTLSIIFAFIIYRMFFIKRLLLKFFPEKEGNENLNNSQQIDDMITETGKKILIIQKRGNGQQQKVQSMNQMIEHINNELNKNMNSQ